MRTVVQMNLVESLSVLFVVDQLGTSAYELCVIFILLAYLVVAFFGHCPNPYGGAAYQWNRGRLASNQTLFM